ncbi:hypothetical protein SAM40697_3161 [Streptomyces ambofaciens]|uniref:Secreted protein n=1 Tax=Streptomyces ambofaciens TaxID=1889 RepID=A0ABN4P9J0_STRAM|nr:hypothetical protein [Streptomyces ambofaciens]ANB07119.1 hypothetical protein SAM40697_3161 [Streptomyces ambofaciens]
MDTFVMVIVLLAVIAAGAFLIHRLNSLHGERIAAFHYRRDGVVAPGQGSPAGHTAHRGTAVSSRTDEDREREHRDGGRGRLLRPRRRTHRKTV